MNKEKLDNVVNDLINYIAGNGRPEYYNDEQGKLFAECDTEWDKLPCDREGANPEQEEAQDELLKEYAEKIIELM